MVGAAGERPLERRISRNAGLELLVTRFPGFPIGEDVREVPLEPIGNLLAPPAASLWGLGGGNVGWMEDDERAHLLTIPATVWRTGLLQVRLLSCREMLWVFPT